MIYVNRFVQHYSCLELNQLNKNYRQRIKCATIIRIILVPAAEFRLSVHQLERISANTVLKGIYSGKKKGLLHRYILQSVPCNIMQIFKNSIHYFQR